MKVNLQGLVHTMATEVDDLHQCLTAQLAGLNKARDVIELRSRTHSSRTANIHEFLELAPVQFTGVLSCDLVCSGKYVSQFRSTSAVSVFKVEEWRCLKPNTLVWG